LPDVRRVVGEAMEKTGNKPPVILPYYEDGGI